MDTDGAPLFCDTALAARIERVEAELMAEAGAAARRRTGRAGFLIPIAGAVATFAEEGSPFNKLVGLGFGGVPTAAELDDVERAFAACGSPVPVELAHLADPAIVELLAAGGYRLVSFENVLGRSVPEDPEPVVLPGVAIRRSGDDEFEAWLDVMADGVAEPDTQGVPWHEEFPREVYQNAERDLAAAGVVRHVAVRDGVLAGGSGFRMAEGVAQLAGAATVPAHRRRGIQSALLAARMVEAAAAGCDVAVVTTQPGSRSQQNVQRQGFSLLYTRAVLVRDL